MEINERLAALRRLMAQQGIAAVVVPSVDPHGSEYVAEHWQERKWVSGFSGSAGTAVITADGGCLWTDSRYFLQAAEILIISIRSHAIAHAHSHIALEIVEVGRADIDIARFDILAQRESETADKAVQTVLMNLRPRS